MDAADSASNQIEQTVQSVAKTARLSRDGQQALLEWSIWCTYATALTIHDPHLIQEPGWEIVLPIDQVAGRNNLRLLLLRAGESAHTAQEAVEAFYKNNPIPDPRNAAEAFYENAPASTALDASLRRMAWDEWLSRLPKNDLPQEVVPFEALPAWARETALFATNLAGKDCRNMPGLKGLDLRYLYAPGVNFEGCDLSACNFFRADLRGVRLKNTNIRGTILPEPSLMRSDASPSSPSHASAPSSPASGATTTAMNL